MKDLDIGTRVSTTHNFLSDGVIKDLIKSYCGSYVVYYLIKLDEKAPNQYAWETDEVLLDRSEIKEK
jgi:hypothetical protein